MSVGAAEMQLETFGLQEEGRASDVSQGPAAMETTRGHNTKAIPPLSPSESSCYQCWVASRNPKERSPAGHALLINSFHGMLFVNKDLMKPIYSYYSGQEDHPLTSVVLFHVHWLFFKRKYCNKTDESAARQVQPAIRRDGRGPSFPAAPFLWVYNSGPTPEGLLKAALQENTLLCVSPASLMT